MSTSLLDRRRPPRKRPYLVYTSAGDHANLHRWLRGRRNFDLWITYYRDQEGRYADEADIYNSRKGSKFQNLRFAYDTWPDIFRAYDAVMVMDDDVVISGRTISRLFDLRQSLDLWVLQPAFNPLGKVSIPITRVQWQCTMRYTNFVEETCPLFRRDKLDHFMSVYDPVLPGYGIDWCFLHSLGPDLEGRVAIIDAITCTNPHDRAKGGVREIDTLQPRSQRVATWETVKHQYGIRNEEEGRREFRRVLKPLPARWLSPLIHESIVYARTKSLRRFLKRQVGRWF